jgi:hypothetical protein
VVWALVCGIEYSEFESRYIKLCFFFILKIFLSSRRISVHNGIRFNWKVLPRATIIALPLNQSIESIYQASRLDVKLSCLLHYCLDVFLEIEITVLMATVPATRA